MKFKASGEYTRRLQQQTKCRDLMEGEDRIKEQGEVYTPRLDKMDDDQYKTYVGRSRLYNSFEKTVTGFVGLAVRTKPVLSYSEAFSPIAQNIDRNGSGVAAYIKHILTEVLVVSRGATLVEFPEVKEGDTLASTKDHRPFWAFYAAEDILDTEYVDGELVFIFLRERVSVRSAFYQQTGFRIRYRELFLEDGVYKQRVYTRKDQTSDEYDQVGDGVIPKMADAPMSFIPVAIHQPDFSQKINKPVLYSLANLCISFFALKADHAHGLHYVALPTPWATGVSSDDEDNPPPSTIGPQEIWVIENENASVGMLEFSGSGLGSILSELDSMKEEMAILGARMVMAETAEKTATAARIKATGETADLSAIVGVLEKQFSWLLHITAAWHAGLSSAEEGTLTSLTLSKNFLPVEISPQMLVALVKARQEGAYDMETLIQNLQRGEIIDPARDVKDVLKAIEKEKEDALLKEAEAMAKFIRENQSG